MRVVVVSVGWALAWGLLLACGDGAAPMPMQGLDPSLPGPPSGPTMDGPMPAQTGPQAGVMGPSTVPVMPPPGPVTGPQTPPAPNMTDAAMPIEPSGPAGSDGGLADAGGDPTPTTGPFPPISDFSKPGSFTSTTVTGTGPGGGYTIYQPSELAADGNKHPLVGWMSGGATTHTGYPLLPLLASHGFVVVAADVVPGIGQEAMLGEQIMDGLAWAIAEAEREGSAYFDRLDTTKVASAGYSMGSLATFMIAGDARLTTTVHISGGNMAPERVQNLKNPAAFICGTPGDASCNILSTDCDIAAANCDTDFQGATTPVFYANFKGGHLGILTAGLTENINAMTATWLRYRLMGDGTLRGRFVGPDCDYCIDSAWKVQQKQPDGL